MFQFKDPVSGGLHFFAAILSIIGLIILIRQANEIDGYRNLIAYTIFGSAMILLYLASSIHHLIPKSIKQTKFFRKIDHSMIFILIAGTYTPICLVSIRGVFGWALLAVVWTLSIFGVALKFSTRVISRGFSTALYIGVGWAAISAISPIIREMTWTGFFWILAGGVFYTIGAAIYAYRKPNPIPKWFGFHEIFHLFVMAGSFCHYWAIFRYSR
jgi:hemolysin III